MAVAHGVATWFCCGTKYGSSCPNDAGKGACGTCDNSKNMCAWPGVSQACLDLVGTCSTHTSFVRSGCGNTIDVEYYCDTSKKVTATIADCGPKVNNFCDETGDCSCDICKDRIIDLTPAAFSALAPLNKGKITVRVTV